jgi:ribonuclease P protein component
MTYHFPKTQRLCSQKTIEELFSQGKVLFLYPFKLYYLPAAVPSTVPPQLLFTVPRKRFRKAVTRNLLKRRMREAYRLQRTLLQNEQGLYTVDYVAMVLVANEVVDYSFIARKMAKLLSQTTKEAGNYPKIDKI